MQACSASDAGALDAELGLRQACLVGATALAGHSPGADADVDLVDGFDFRKKKAGFVEFVIYSKALSSGVLTLSHLEALVLCDAVMSQRLARFDGRSNVCSLIPATCPTTRRSLSASR